MNKNKLTLKKALRIKRMEYKFIYQDKQVKFDIMMPFSQIGKFLSEQQNWQNILKVYYIIFVEDENNSFDTWVEQYDGKDISQVSKEILKQISFFLPCQQTTRHYCKILIMQIQKQKAITNYVIGQEFLSQLQLQEKNTGTQPMVS